MSFGGSTIVFRHFVESGSADEYGNYVLVPVDVSAPGCRHRPLTFKETAELQFDIATEMWRSTLPLCEYVDPLLATCLAAQPDDVIVVDGKEYQIIGGVRPHDDMEGVPFKMTIISKKQIG